MGIIYPNPLLSQTQLLALHIFISYAHNNPTSKLLQMRKFMWRETKYFLSDQIANSKAWSLKNALWGTKPIWVYRTYWQFLLFLLIMLNFFYGNFSLGRKKNTNIYLAIGTILPQAIPSKANSMQIEWGTKSSPSLTLDAPF